MQHAWLNRLSRVGIMLRTTLAISVTACASRSDNEATAPLVADSTGPPAVLTENAKPGNADWYPQKPAPKAQLALWASPYAPGSGDTLDVFVNATKGPIDVRLYRLGWYDGKGARLVWERDSVAAGPQPPCTSTAAEGVTCPWANTLRIPLDTSLVGGIYVLRAMDAAGLSSYYPVVLKSLRSAQFTVVIPQLTWQAYNSFGGRSLYTAEPTSTSGLGTVVSFERPYSDVEGASVLFSTGYSHELRVVRWLERNRYDVAYVSGAELAVTNSGIPIPRKGLIFAGHDEYWTSAEFDRVERFRESGIHLAFLSGNNAYWNVRLAAGTTTGRPAHRVFCFKSSNDPGATRPSEVTTRFRNVPLNRPENALVGIMYLQGATNDLRPLVSNDSGLLESGFAIMRASGLQRGDSIPQTVGSEGDQIVENGHTPTGLQVLFKSPITVTDRYPPNGPPFYYSTFYTAPSGAGVFAAGSNDFARSIDGFLATPESAKLQAFTAAILDWMRSH